MFTLLIVLHVVFCIFLILVILLQTGKGAGIGAAFGGGSQTVFGPRGAGSFIGKLTGIVAALFMITSLVLAYLSSSGSSRIADKVGALSDEAATEVEEVELGEKTEDTEMPASTAGSKGNADSGPRAIRIPDGGSPSVPLPETAPQASPAKTPSDVRGEAAPKEAPTSSDE